MEEAVVPITSETEEVIVSLLSEAENVVLLTSETEKCTVPSTSEFVDDNETVNEEIITDKGKANLE